MLTSARRLGLVAVILAAWLTFLRPSDDFLLMCQDNSGAYKMKVMGVVGKGNSPHIRAIEPGDVVVVVGRTGGPKNKVLRAIVTRMRRGQPDPLKNGMQNAFDTNCGVLVDKEGNPVGSKILGKIDPRCAMRWPKLAQLAARDDYFKKSMAAFLQGDSLRVFHPENSLVRGYLGNTECHNQYQKYPQNQKCKGRIAEFWTTALDELNRSQVQVDHTVIKGGENGIDQYFIDFDIKKAFEEYKARFPKQWAGQPSNNFDLCAFATGMGYVDLCSGAFSLTRRRQAMTFVIELYTSPVFMVSRSKCDFLVSEDLGSKKFWVWWFLVFSPRAWLFFLGVVFFFIVAMKCLDTLGEGTGQVDTDSNCFWSITRKVADAFIGVFEAFCLKRNAMDKDNLDKCRNCFWSIARKVADAFIGVFEAFVLKSKTSPWRLSQRPRNSRSSHMLRLGLGFFILLSTTLYGANITSKLVSAKEVKGEFPSLQAAWEIAQGPGPLGPFDPCVNRNITLCTNSALKDFLNFDRKDNFLLGLDTWEEVLTGLKSGTCNAALLAEEAWKTFRNRAELCGFYQNPTPEFYLPQGAVVSKRAYRTLETFRFAPTEPSVFLDKSKVPTDSCHGTSAEDLCDNKGGVPWYTLFSLFLVAAACGLCSLLGIVHKNMGGVDSEADEEDPSHQDLGAKMINGSSSSSSTDGDQ